MAVSLAFLNLPQRRAKPRQCGLTLVRDPGLSVRQLEDALQTFGQFLDYAKIKQFELFYMDEAPTRAKVALYRKHAVSPFCGGTVIEAAMLQGKVAQTLKKLVDIGFQSIELSDNIVDMSLVEKGDLTRRAVDAGFEVLFEYGKKYDSDPIDVAVAVDEIGKLRSAGANRVILERSQLDATLGPEGRLPTAGRMKDLARQVGLECLIFEAETTAHQNWLLHELGPDVNLGPNIHQDEVVSRIEPARCGLGRAEGYSLFAKLGHA
ncbi:MAG: phosphosulfolactate synthase [Betaproteobacteria bacterium]|nr:phosphosulfolactate synthase [Betaproteobacteria bacterium]